MALNRTDFGTLVAVLIGAILTLVLPIVLDLYSLIQITLYAVLAIYTLSLAYVWGYGGIMCFGQSMFFGLGGYAYAVMALNMQSSVAPMLLAVALPAVFAAALGYFMFYGRLNDVFVGIVTLVVTLILYQLIGQTAGAQYTIGAAPLGGYNGIPSVPGLNQISHPDVALEPDGVFAVVMTLLVVTYLGLKLLQRSAFGRVTVGIRESETRASLLGYDVRRHKLIVFAIGGGIAGLAGGLYAAYQSFIDPNAFTLLMSAQALIWVMVGGVGTLVGPILGCCLLQYVSAWLGTVHIANNNLVLGIILMIFVLALPKGLLPASTAALEVVLRGFKRGGNHTPDVPPVAAKGSRA